MSPKSQLQFEVIRKKSKTAIKEAALELFAQSGFHGTSVSSIAQKAGVSKGLLYNYFSSKDHLLETIFEEAIQLSNEFMQDAFSAKPNEPGATIEYVIDIIIDRLKERPRYFKLLTALSFQEDIMIRYQDRLTAHHQKSMRMIIEQLGKMGVANAELETLYIGAILDGITLHYIHMGQSYPIEAMRAFIKQKLNTNYES